jgi:TRAP-type C4-dicarboxylate transport system permease small subunit
MSGLFGDPVSWAGSMVKTRARFTVFALAWTLILLGAFYFVGSSPWPNSAPYLTVPVAFQLMLLYALRRLYVLITDSRVG